MGSTAFPGYKGDEWGQLAAQYSKLTQQTTYEPIGLMLRHADTLWPFSQATGILDNGCGPGPIMSRIINDYGSQLPSTCTLACSDLSEPMINQVQIQKEQAGANSLWARVQTLVQDAMDLKDISNESQSHVTAGMVYFMATSPRKCLDESLRVLRPSGALTLSSWEGSDWSDLMSCASLVCPDRPFPTIPETWRSTEGIKGEMQQAGFRDVEAYQVPVQMEFQDHESICEFFATKLPPMTALTKGIGEEVVRQIIEVMVKELKNKHPSAPGKMDGMVLVGVGRK